LSDAIQVSIEQLPTSNTSLWLAGISGILVPLAVLWVSGIFANNAERRAREYSDRVRESDFILAQYQRTFEILDELYRAVQRLRANNMRRKHIEQLSKETVANNQDIIASDSDMAKMMQQDLLARHFDKEMEADFQHQERVIELHTVLARLQNLLGNKATELVKDIVMEVSDSSGKPGGVTSDLAERFTKEINALGRLIENDPDSFFSPPSRHAAHHE
jgi:uncharacterized membrane protein YcjF (UPF0283 family)